MPRKKPQRIEVVRTQEMNELIDKIEQCTNEQELKLVRLEIASRLKGKELEFTEVQRFYTRKKSKVVTPRKNTLNLNTLFTK